MCWSTRICTPTFVITILLLTTRGWQRDVLLWLNCFTWCCVLRRRNDLLVLCPTTVQWPGVASYDGAMTCWCCVLRRRNDLLVQCLTTAQWPAGVVSYDGVMTCWCCVLRRRNDLLVLCPTTAQWPAGVVSSTTAIDTPSIHTWVATPGPLVMNASHGTSIKPLIDLYANC